MPGLEKDDQLLRQYGRLLLRARRRGPAALEPTELALLPRLQRHASSVLARLESGGGPRAGVAAMRRMIAEGNDLVAGPPIASRRSPLAVFLEFFLVECPRTIRAEWRIVLLIAVAYYSLAAVTWFAVASDLDLAYSLLDPAAVENEMEQLRSTPAGEPFRGNFTFGLEDSAETSGLIMFHNMFVGVLLFAAALVPPLFFYLFAINGLMLGAYTGVAWSWGQAGSLSSILWCHGTLELQALVLAGAAGCLLAWSVIAPGPWSRGHSLFLASRRSWRLLAPAFPMLFVAGLIEGYVSPHAPLEVRVAVAVLSALALVSWIAFGGRRPVSRDVTV